MRAITPSPVPDVRLVQNLLFPKYSVTMDWEVRGDGSLDDTEALATGIVVALGTNGLADIDDLLPDPDSTDRAGWWGDLDAEDIWDGWPIGSKLWLMSRAAIEPVQSRHGSTMAHIRNYIYAAIQPFIDRKIATSFEATIARIDKQRVDSIIRIYRGPKTMIELRYQILWDELYSHQTFSRPASPYP